MTGDQEQWDIGSGKRSVWQRKTCVNTSLHVSMRSAFPEIAVFLEGQVGRVRNHDRREYDVSLFCDFCDMLSERVVFSDISFGSTSRHQAEHSGSQQRCWNHCDSIFAAIGLRAGVNHDCVQQVVADLFSQPHQVSAIATVDRSAQLDLDGNNPAVGSVPESKASAFRPSILTASAGSARWCFGGWPSRFK
jgi:hypothetical protein